MHSLIEFFILTCLLASTEQCLKTLPPEEIYITSTTIMFETTTVNLCNDCDIEEIIQDQGGNKVVPNDIRNELEDGCIKTYVQCYNEDLYGCLFVKLYAESGENTEQIGNFVTTSADGVLNCDKDGTYFSGNVKNIRTIYCIFNGCKHNR
uniref:DUF281 domain-containing protein n=2 Tax=Caenorhabditis japonica TaxID=281687 RepID=A0A8R1EUU7_CAEJA